MVSLRIHDDRAQLPVLVVTATELVRTSLEIQKSKPRTAGTGAVTGRQSENGDRPARNGLEVSWRSSRLAAVPKIDGP